MQVIWYLGITGRKRGHIAVLIGGQSFKTRVVEFDAELFEIMVNMAVEFWDCVQTKTMPAIAPEDNEVMSKIYPDINEEYIENQDLESQIEKLVSIKAEMSALDVEKKLLEAELKNIINTHAGILTDKYKVSWYKVTRPIVNTEQLKADNLYEKYTSSSTTRSLRVFDKKKKAA